MLGLVRAMLGRLRYRRRWRLLAAAATAKADSATAQVDRAPGKGTVRPGAERDRV